MGERAFGTEQDRLTQVCQENVPKQICDHHQKLNKPC